MDIKHLYRPVLLASLSLAATAACAEGFTFGGFGTVGGVKIGGNAVVSFAEKGLL